VLAIELLTAARALDLRAPLAPAPATGAVVAGLRNGSGNSERERNGSGSDADGDGEGVRAGVAGAAADRFLAPEIEAAVAYVATGAAVRAAEAVTGALE